MTTPQLNVGAPDLATLKSNAYQELGNLKTLDKDAKEHKLADIKEMIERYTGMTDAIEDRRIKIHDLSFQLLGISLAGLGVLFSNNVNVILPVKWAIVSLLAVQVFFSLWGLLLFLRQSRFPYYPFRELPEFGNKWKWFYYGNQQVLKISTDVYRPSTDPSETLVPYLRGLRDFAHNYATEQLDDELSDGVQQLYLMQVHNYYKNRFYLQLVRVREISIYFSIAALIIGAILALFANPWLAGLGIFVSPTP